MSRVNDFLLLRTGKWTERLWDLVLKPVVFGGLLFLQNVVRRAGLPVVDKRCGLLMKASMNICNYYGDKGLTRWFQLAKWEVFCKLQGSDNAYMVRDLLVFDEYARLVKEAQRKGETFPNGKTSEYVEREIVAKGYDKLEVEV